MQNESTPVPLVLQLQCCGVHNPSDWQRAGFAGNTLPKSCCTELPTNNPTCDTNDIKSNPEGCKKQLQKKIEENALILGGVGIGVALIQVRRPPLFNFLFSRIKFR